MNNEINVMQMIDSLSVGGAERMSINYANALSEKDNVNSFICVTREEGLLKEFIKSDVNYFFMKKKNNKDYKSFYNLFKFIKENKIDIIHAHSSSFFTASLIKIFTGVKVIWHDHYGKSEDLKNRPFFMLKIFSFFFSYVISVNDLLKNWALKTLFIKDDKVVYIQNYADLDFSDKRVILPGKDGKRIVLLANLREQKNHFLAMKAFQKFLLENKELEDWSLLFVGRDFGDSYSCEVKNFISKNSLDKNIFILGARTDTADILKSCDIGVLSSDSEGLPVALLEYGLARLPIIVTDVGQCKNVLNSGITGILIEKGNEDLLVNAFERYILDSSFRDKKADESHIFIKSNFSKESVVKKLIDIYINILKGK